MVQRVYLSFMGACQVLGAPATCGFFWAGRQGKSERGNK